LGRLGGPGENNPGDGEESKELKNGEHDVGDCATMGWGDSTVSAGYLYASRILT
jgi:hypothetical protein